MKAHSPIEVTDDGIDICSNEEHPQKALYPIDVIDEGFSNVICINDEQLSKTHFSMEVTDDGIDILVNE